MARRHRRDDDAAAARIALTVERDRVTRDCVTREKVPASRPQIWIAYPQVIWQCMINAPNEGEQANVKVWFDGTMYYMGDGKSGFLLVDYGDHYPWPKESCGPTAISISEGVEEGDAQQLDCTPNADASALIDGWASQYLPDMMCQVTTGPTISSYSNAKEAQSACDADRYCVYIEDEGCDGCGMWRTCTANQSPWIVSATEHVGTCLYRR